MVGELWQVDMYPRPAQHPSPKAQPRPQHKVLGCLCAGIKRDDCGKHAPWRPAPTHRRKGAEDAQHGQAAPQRLAPRHQQHRRCAVRHLRGGGSMAEQQRLSARRAHTPGGSRAGGLSKAHHKHHHQQAHGIHSKQGTSLSRPQPHLRRVAGRGGAVLLEHRAQRAQALHRGVTPDAVVRGHHHLLLLAALGVHHLQQGVVVGGGGQVAGGWMGEWLKGRRNGSGPGTSFTRCVAHAPRFGRCMARAAAPCRPTQPKQRPPSCPPWSSPAQSRT